MNASTPPGPTSRDRTLVKVIGTTVCLLLVALLATLCVRNFSSGSGLSGIADALLVAFFLTRAVAFARGTAGVPLVAWLAARRR